MRIPSGKTDQSIYFVAVDATDYVTRETGLTGFTVVRSRNGAADVTYTTPTVTEVDSTTMPGVYALLIDEDTTIASGSDSEEYCLHITKTGMAPVTRTIELYRRDTTSGQTIDVASGGVEVNSFQTGAITTAAFAAGAIDAAAIADGAIDRATFAVETGLRSIRSGTAQAGAAGTITLDASAAATTDFYDGCVIYTTGGTGVGQHRICTAYNGTTKVATITPNWATTPDNTTTFAVLPAGHVNLTAIGGAILSTTTAQIGANAVQAGGTAWSSGAITAASIASNAITSAKIATDAIGAAQIAADAIGSSELAASAVTEIQTGLATSAALTTVETKIDTIDLNVDAILVDTGTDIPATLTTILADTNELQTDWANGGRLDLILDARASQTSVDDIPTNSELTTALSGLATSAALATVDGNVDTIVATTNKLDDTLEDDAGTFRFTTNALEQAPTGGSAPSAADIRTEIDNNSTQLAAIKAKTDSLTFTVGGQVDSNIQYVNDVQVSGVGSEANPWGP